MNGRAAPAVIPHLRCFRTSVLGGAGARGVASPFCAGEGLAHTKFPRSHCAVSAHEHANHKPRRWSADFGFWAAHVRAHALDTGCRSPLLHQQQQRHAHATQQRDGRHRLSKHASGTFLLRRACPQTAHGALVRPARRKEVADGITAAGTDPDLSTSVSAVWCGKIPGSPPILQLRLPARGNHPAAATAAAAADAVSNPCPLHAYVHKSSASLHELCPVRVFDCVFSPRLSLQLLLSFVSALTGS